MTQHFDVAVIGRERSGILAAALLAKRGRRVVLIAQNERPHTYDHAGFELTLMPSITPAFSDSPVIDLVHRELGLGPEVRNATTPLEPSFQVVLAKHRIDVRPKREALLDELRLEFPELGERLRGFLERLYGLDAQISRFLEASPPLPPSGFRERLRLRAAARAVHSLGNFPSSEQLFAGIPAGHPLRDLLIGPLSFFGHLPADNLSGLQAARLMARVLRGTVSFDRHPGGLNDVLLQAAQRSGVDLRRAAVVTRFQTRRRRVIGFELQDDRLPYTTDFVINTTVHGFDALVRGKHRTGKRAGRQAAARGDAAAIGGMMVLNVVVKAEVVPCGMARTVFVLDGRRLARGENPPDAPLLVRRTTARRSDAPGSASQGGTAQGEDKPHEVLTVACPAAADPTKPASAEVIAATTQQVVRRLSTTIPFLRDFIVDVSVAGIETGDDNALIAPAAPGASLRLHPIFEPRTQGTCGLGEQPMRTEFKNVTCCGPHVLPGLGLEGEYVAALAAVRTLERWAGRKWRKKQ